MKKRSAEVRAQARQPGFYPVDCEAARQAGDACGIWEDLHHSAESFSRLKQVLEADPYDAVVGRSLWKSAIIDYARCFISGKRYSLNRSVFDGRYPAPRGSIEQHSLLMSFRDKNVGHSVSAFEQTRVGVMVGPGENGGLVVVASGALHARHHTRKLDAASRALRHVEALRDYVRMVSARLQEEVRIIGASLPISEILNAGEIIIAAPEVEDAGKSRHGAVVRSIPGLD